MKLTRPLWIFALFAFLNLFAATLMVPTLHAQMPDKFTNLKVLPKDISKQDLTATMRRFSSSLGVHCGYCHARAEGGARGEMDWASDAKQEKVTARVMMQMAQMINSSELPKITTKHPDKVEVQCRTCHHGEPRPYLIEDLLSTAYKTGGIDSLTAKYESLRKDYYGSDTYDFGVEMLPELGERLAGADPAQAVKIAEYNVQKFPDSGEALFALGRAHAAAGDKEKAMAELKKAAELEPDLKENVQRMLDRMQAK